jgi:hypothetical protein
MPIPKDMDPDAVKLFEEHDWPWSDWAWSFVQARRPGKESTESYRRRQPPSISYEELQDHNLIITDTRDIGQAAEAVAWLQKKIESLEPA